VVIVTVYETYFRIAIRQYLVSGSDKGRLIRFYYPVTFNKGLKCFARLDFDEVIISYLFHYFSVVGLVYSDNTKLKHKPGIVNHSKTGFLNEPAVAGKEEK
jgi:hypothetical protein